MAVLDLEGVAYVNTDHVVSMTYPRYVPAHSRKIEDPFTDFAHWYVEVITVSGDFRMKLKTEEAANKLVATWKALHDN